MGLNKNIYNLRKERGFSQEYMAEKINVSRQTISKWESNQSSPDIHPLIQNNYYYFQKLLKQALIIYWVMI